MNGIERVRDALTGAFPEATVEVRDLTGTGDHVEARVVTAAFEGKGLLERHRMVYGALGNAFQGPVHALMLKTLTPAEAGTKTEKRA